MTLSLVASLMSIILREKLSCEQSVTNALKSWGKDDLIPEGIQYRLSLSLCLFSLAINLRKQDQPHQVFKKIR